MAHYIEAVKLEPKDPEIYCTLGDIKASQDKFKEAKIYYDKALKLNPKNARVYYSLGITMLVQDNFDEAIIYFKEALKLQPDWEQLRLGLQMAVQQRDYKKQKK